MNKQLILVASLALALGGPAFAQSYSTPTTPTNPPATQPTPPTDDQAEQAEQTTEKAAEQTEQATEQANAQNEEATEQPAQASKPAAKPVKRVARVSHPMPPPMSGSAAVLAPSVPPVISASAPQPTAANHYDPRKDLKTKVYPTTDKAHTAGDPPVIDHSADIAPVANPTTSVAAVPPAG